jgi:hypothetical protein
MIIVSADHLYGAVLGAVMILLAALYFGFFYFRFLAKLAKFGKVAVIGKSSRGYTVKSLASGRFFRVPSIAGSTGLEKILTFGTTESAEIAARREGYTQILYDFTAPTAS